MKILLFGKNGQVGWELQRALACMGEVVALDRSGINGLCGDLAQLEGLADCVRAVAPHVIVNAAAYTAVDKAESNAALAQQINGVAPSVLAREAERLGAWLVHYSTDYVFDGTGNCPWHEDHPTSPLSIHGRTKRAGEAAIAANSDRFLIFRTSWVYATRGNNFAKTMLHLAKDRDTLNVVSDQIGAPTGADLVADITALALRQVSSSSDSTELSGIYHLAAAGETSWHGYARFVLENARHRGISLKVLPDQMGAISTDEYATPACRPRNSRLNTAKLQQTFNVHMPPWRQGVERMLSEILD